MIALVAMGVAVLAETETDVLPPVPLFGEFTDENAEDYFMRGKPFVTFAFDPEHVTEHVDAHKHAAEDAAGAYPDHSFVWFNTQELENAAQEMLGCQSFPCISLVEANARGDLDDFMVYTRPIEMHFQARAVHDFIEDVRNGKVERFLPERAEDEDEDDFGEDDEETWDTSDGGEEM